MNKKKYILAILVLLIIVFIGVKKINDSKKKQKVEINSTTYVQILEDGTKYNTSTKLSEIKKVGNLEFDDSQLTNKNGKTTLLANVKNIGNKKIEWVELEIILIDQNGNELDTLDSLLGTIKPGENIQLNAETTNDYSNIYDYIVKIK